MKHVIWGRLYPEILRIAPQPDTRRIIARVDRLQVLTNNLWLSSIRLPLEAYKVPTRDKRIGGRSRTRRNHSTIHIQRVSGPHVQPVTVPIIQARQRTRLARLIILPSTRRTQCNPTLIASLPDATNERNIFVAVGSTGTTGNETDSNPPPVIRYTRTRLRRYPR